MQVFDQLKKEAQYALNSHSRDELFYELNTMLIKDGLNNPAVAKMLK